MGAIRLRPAQLAEHLVLESPETQRLVRVLRRVVLRAAPQAAEGIKFHSLCYFHPDAEFGAIGGNICMIEVRRGEVALSFIHGVHLSDPGGLLQGKGTAKRRVLVRDRAAAADPRLCALIRAAADRRLDAS